MPALSLRLQCGDVLRKVTTFLETWKCQEIRLRLGRSQGNAQSSGQVR